METDDGHVWLHPSRFHYEDRLVPIGRVLPVLLVSQALAKVGVLRPEGLAVVANEWRQVAMRLDLTWTELREANSKTLLELERKGLLQEQPGEVYQQIIDYWQFPMYDLDLRIIPVDKETLRERQRNWAPY